ncbi:MAG: c-type cytochrome, partial [Bacteroidia bacterium]
LSDKAPSKALRGVKASAELALKDGRVLYQQYCVSCHKEDGKGVVGAFPALAGSAIVQGGPDKLTSLVLNGTAQQMPAFKFLKDEELAQLLTYVRNQWGNKSGEITTSTVKKQR